MSKKGIRLLEVKKSDPSPEKTKEQLEKEQLELLIKQKLEMFEEGKQEGISLNSASQATPKEDAINAKLTKLFQNKDLDNKQKIAEMVELFNAEVRPQYQQSFKDVVTFSNELTRTEMLTEYQQAQTKRAEIIQQKYQVLSQEYQSQAKQFKTKHEEISKNEVTKRQEIINNFENHFASIKSQMDDDHKKLVEENGEYTITKENRDLQEKYEEL